MKKFNLSVFVEEEDGSNREFKLEFAPVSTGNNQYQPVITVRDSRTGSSSVNHLPISDYASLREKLSHLFSMNPEELKNKARKIMTMLSLFG